MPLVIEYRHVFSWSDECRIGSACLGRGKYCGEQDVEEVDHDSVTKIEWQAVMILLLWVDWKSYKITPRYAW